MNDLINKITDKIQFSIGNKNIAGNDVNISKHKIVIKELNYNVFTDTEKNNKTIHSIILKINERIDRMNDKLDSLNLEPNIKSVAHYEDIDNFIKLGLRSDMDIVDFLTDNIEKIVNSNQQSERNVILDAEKFILNASENEIALLIWSVLYKTFFGNLIKNKNDSKWIDNYFIDHVIKPLREKYPLKNKFVMPNDLISFSKVGCNATTLIRNITLTKEFISDNKINIPNGVTFEDIFKKIPEFDTKKPEKQNFLIGIDNLAFYVNKSLQIAAIYFLRKLKINVII